MNPPSVSPLELRNVSGTCSDGTSVNGISAAFAAGRVHLLRGANESGKTALFRYAGLLEESADGEALVNGGTTRTLGEDARTELRTQRFGFVFAAPFLLCSFSVIENVAMPLFKISQVGPDEARRRTEALLDFVGLNDLAETIVDHIEPYAQYQVALARGLINEPAVLMVENLDGTLAAAELSDFMEMLRKAAGAFDAAIIATTSPEFQPQAGDRVLDIVDGAIARDSEIQPEICE